MSGLPSQLSSMFSPKAGFLQLDTKRDIHPSLTFKGMWYDLEKAQVIGESVRATYKLRGLCNAAHG